jgi:Domain of unknown function (DUF4268)
VIWVAPHFREEFRRGLEWLNERTDQQVDFFGVEIGLVRIGRSLPAPVLDVAVQPRNWRKAGRRRTPLPMKPPATGPAVEPTPPVAVHVPDAARPPRGRHEPPPPDPPSAARSEPAPDPPPAARSDPPPEPAADPEPFAPPPAAAPPRPAPSRPAPAPPPAPPPMASERAGGLQPVELRHEFFEAMFDFVAIRRPGFRIPKFGYENWVGFAAGPFGFYDVAFTANGAVRAGIYLDMQERTSTKRLFDDLFAERLAVETAVGRILSWERLDDRRASRIVDYRELRDLDSSEERRMVADWAAETVVKLMEALDDRLRSTAAVLLSRVQGGV